MTNTSPVRHRGVKGVLFRSLEARLRGTARGERLQDVRWKLGRLGVEASRIEAFERSVRRTVRLERTAGGGDIGPAT